MLDCDEVTWDMREPKVIGDAVRGISREAPEDEEQADARVRRVLSDTAQPDE